MRITGNLGIIDHKDKIGLVIWPQIGGGYKYGVIVDDKKMQYQITLDSDFNPVNEYHKEIVKKNKEKINNIIEKADEMWDLK